MPLDNAKNFARATVSTGYNAAATSIVLTTGHGARLPAAPFNATWWNSSDYLVPDDDPNVELVRVTAKATDTLTITRAQESTTASTKNTSGKTYTMLAGLTAKVINEDVVSRSGDTMSGTLTLSASPTSPLHAANKGYVDAIATGQLTGTYLISSFNASGSDAHTQGWITSGTNSLVVASAATFAIGQGIFVAGAGPGGIDLITSITAIAGTTFTLAANAATTVAAAVVAHDDTVAIQTALNLLSSVQVLTLVFDSGYYRVNGAVNSATNSILSIPFNTWLPGPVRTLRLIGQDCPISPVTQTPLVRGSVIQSSVVGTDANSSIFAAGLYLGGSDFGAIINATNCVTIEIRGLFFRTLDNPPISAVDLAMCWNVVMENVCIDTGVAPEGLGLSDAIAGAEPTHGTFGLRLPRASTIVQTTNVSVACYAIGVWYADLWNSRNTYIIRCKTGCYTRGHDYPIVGDLLIVQCATGIHVEGNALGRPGMDLHIRWEIDPRALGRWWEPIANRYIYDPTNVLFGQLKYYVVQGYVPGVGGAITVTGSTALTKTNLHA